MKATVALHSAAAPFLSLIFDEDELDADEETLFIVWNIKKQHENFTFTKTDLISASFSQIVIAAPSSACRLFKIVCRFMCRLKLKQQKLEQRLTVRPKITMTCP